MMSILYIDEIKDLREKLVFIRVDFNVPQDDNGNITEDTRIVGAVPTIKYAIENGAKVILASHLGRPKGEKKPKYTMAPAARRLSELLGKEVKQASDCFGPDVDAMVAALQPGDVLMLENVRFYPGEEKNDPDFACTLANGCEIYVNDAFAVSHRAHASVHAITKCIPVIAAGFLMKNEMTFSKSDDQPGPSVGGHSRRSKGFRQAGGSRDAGRQGRHNNNRRWNGIHFS